MTLMINYEHLHAFGAKLGWIGSIDVPATRWLIAELEQLRL